MARKDSRPIQHSIMKYNEEILLNKVVRLIPAKMPADWEKWRKGLMNILYQGFRK